ncbi:MAG TPA: energy transducer TonB [Opitutaceae bacterium]|nr:energy transducer TonB [Opitutaceae bacterium]
MPLAGAALRTLPADSPGACSVGGDWHYYSPARSRKRLAIALLLSASLHAAIFVGLGRPKPRLKKVEKESYIALTIEMPQIKDLEELDQPPDDAAERPDNGTPVPMQADVPQAPSPNDFVQQFDYSSLIEKPDVSNLKLTAIPEHILRGGKIDSSLGKIFDLSDLDRIPEAIVQTPPIFPPALKREVSRAVVRVEFIVNTEGRVVNPFVVESTHPGFNDAAATGVGRWKFKPGIRGGRKVNTRMQVPIIFRLGDED